MKKLILICASAMLLSAPIFAQSGSSASPSGTGTEAGAGPTMSQPSDSAPTSGSMTAPASGTTNPQEMEEDAMDAGPDSNLGSGSSMESEEDKSKAP